MEINIKKIAKLAKIKIKPGEEEKFTNAILDISSQMDKIPHLPLDINLLDSKNPMTLREDKAVDKNNRDLILKNAPKSTAGCVVVPRTVE